jgi:phage tail-like protein
MTPAGFPREISIMAATLSRDPYKNFRFKIFFDDDKKKPVAGISGVSGLSWSADVIGRHQGGSCRSERKVPGLVTYEPVSFSRGITTDKKFKEWAEKVWNYNNFNPLKGLRKTLLCDLCDENGKSVVRYTLSNCWISGYEALPELSAEDNAVAIETITVEHEGWEHEILGGTHDEYGRDATLSV